MDVENMCVGETGDVRNYRWGGPHAPTQTLTPTDETIMPPNTFISQGDSSVGGGRGVVEEEGELMENGVVSQLIGDALPGLQCLLFSSWLPDAIMNCTDTVSLWLLQSGSTALNAELLEYGL